MTFIADFWTLSSDPESCSVRLLCHTGADWGFAQKWAISDHKQKKINDISKIDGVIAIFVSQANFSEIFRFFLANLKLP